MENNSHRRHNKWPCKKLKNWSSDTDIRPMLDVVCGNIQCTVQHESTGSAGASVTTSSTGMSSSINKELFQRGDIEVSRRSLLVSQKWTTSMTFRWYFSHRYHIHCVSYFTLQCRVSPLSHQVNVAPNDPSHDSDRHLGANWIKPIAYWSSWN